MASNINRRTVLRGAGLTLGLPMLEVMKSSAATLHPGDSPESPVRMACVFFPNGAIMPDWKPTGDGEQWTLSKTLKSLTPFQSKLNVIENLAHDNGRGYADGAGDHARCASTFLTASRPVKTSGNIRLGISVDQIAAAQLSGETRLPSLELGLEPSRNAGSCDSGYSCAYSSNISWRNETQPMPKEVTPRMAFERMFGNAEMGDRHERNMLRQSILDLAREDANDLMRRVTRTDRRKLDEYFSSIREIEIRIQRSEKEDQAALPDLEVPFGRVEAFREHARLMYDLMAIGFQTDTTRVATLMLDNAGGNRRYTEVGIKDAHHQMSHHQNRIELVEKLQKIDQYLVEQFAYFLGKLDSIPEGDGTLLDHSMVLYGSGISDGNRHRHEDLPIVLAGGAGGQFKTGSLIRPVGNEVPMGNLFLSMLDAMGTPVDAIGDSSGRLTELSG
ncbi:DUF1552 domain-containing protein [bacterium]|nr:DUF1552 domain-containing protein [bacterium]